MRRVRCVCGQLIMLEDGALFDTVDCPKCKESIPLSQAAAKAKQAQKEAKQVAIEADEEEAPSPTEPSRRISGRQRGRRHAGRKAKPGKRPKKPANPAETRRIALSIMGLILGPFFAAGGALGALVLASLSPGQVGSFSPERMSKGVYESYFQIISVGQTLVGVLILVGGILLLLQSRAGLSMMMWATYAGLGLRILDALLAFSGRMSLPAGLIIGMGFGIGLYVTLAIAVYNWAPSIEEGLSENKA